MKSQTFFTVIPIFAIILCNVMGVDGVFLPRFLPTCGEGSDGYHADDDDCNKYYQCVHGRPVGKTCPPGTVFNDDINVCVHISSHLDKCTKYPERECKQDPTQLIPHTKACQRYYDCSDGRRRSMYSLLGKYEQECPHPQLFDINQKRCVHFKNAVCGEGRVAAKWKCDYVAYMCRTSHCIPCQYHSPSCVGKSDGVWPHPMKLWSPYFTTCESERSKNGEEKCPPNHHYPITQLFDPEKRQCLPLWEISREHGGFKPSCDGKSNGVYEIEGVEIIAYTCPTNEKFLCMPPVSYDKNLSRCKKLK